MNVVMVLVMLGLAGFSIVSGAREIAVYRRAVKGEVPYLASRSRLIRRLLISALLLCESILLFVGSFMLSFTQAGASLLFWTLALLVMVPVVYMALIDMREMRRDLDRIFHEAALAALKAAEKKKQES